MSEKHLAKGDALPPLTAGKLRLYSMRFCPYAQRTRLVLLHKKIPHEIVNINLASKPDWFLERNPAGKVPTLEIDGKVVYESTICNDYLDETYPECKLNPNDPYTKARQKMLLEDYSKVVSSFYKYAMGGLKDNEALEELFKCLDPFEKVLNGKYFGGDTVGMIDFLLWPHLERMFNFDKMPSDRFAKIFAWKANMMSLDEVKQTYTTPENQTRFAKGYAIGKSEYDF